MQTQKQVGQETSQLVRSGGRGEPALFTSLLLIDKNHTWSSSLLAEQVNRFCPMSDTHRRRITWPRLLKPLRCGQEATDQVQSVGPSMKELMLVTRGGGSLAEQRSVVFESIFQSSRNSDFSPGTEMCCWCAGCLELCGGWWFGGGHDLHVLCEDGLESLVSVDHGTKHQWLEERDAE